MKKLIRYNQRNIDILTEELLFCDNPAEFSAVYYDEIMSTICNAIDMNYISSIDYINNIYNKCIIICNDERIDQRRRLLIALRMISLSTAYVMKDFKSFNVSSEINENFIDSCYDLFVPWLNSVSERDLTLDISKLDNVDCCILSEMFLFCCVINYSEFYDRYSMVLSTVSSHIKLNNVVYSDDYESSLDDDMVMSMYIGMTTNVWSFLSTLKDVSDWIGRKNSPVEPIDYVDLFLLYWEDNEVQPTKWLADATSIDCVSQILFTNSVNAIKNRYIDENISKSTKGDTSFNMVRTVEILQSSLFIMCKTNSNMCMAASDALSSFKDSEAINDFTDCSHMISLIELALFILAGRSRTAETADALMHSIQKHKATPSHYAMVDAYIAYANSTGVDTGNSFHAFTRNLYSYNSGAYRRYIS